MSDDPFEHIPFLGDLAKMLGNQAGASWDAARQLAVSIATDGQPEGNVDPLDRIAIEELARVAELHVASLLDLPVHHGGLLSVKAVTPGVWASLSLDAYKPLFERLATALAGGGALGSEIDPEAQMMAGLMKFLQPMMLGLSAGSMVGHLARRSMGAYDLPVPRPSASELLVVPATIARFADDWSLPVADVRLWVCLSELTHHAVLAVPHVRETLDGLLAEWAGCFEPNPRAIEDRLAAIDLSDASSLEGLQAAFADPQALLGAMESDRQRALRPRLDALVAVIIGVVDHVLDAAGAGLLSSFGPLSEAIRRQRVEVDQADRFVQQLLGLAVGQDQVERGSAFVKGIIERAGGDGLARLWSAPQNLPTPAEVDAPGLWLARIEFTA